MIKNAIYNLDLNLSYSQDLTNVCNMLDKIEFTDMDLYNLTKKYNDNYIFMKQVYNYMEKKKINLLFYGKTFESFLKQNKILNFLDSVKSLSLDNFNFKLDK